MNSISAFECRDFTDPAFASGFGSGLAFFLGLAFFGFLLWRTCVSFREAKP